MLQAEAELEGAGDEFGEDIEEEVQAADDAQENSKEGIEQENSFFVQISNLPQDFVVDDLIQIFKEVPYQKVIFKIFTVMIFSHNHTVSM